MSQSNYVPVYVRFDAPNKILFEDALWVLERSGYQEVLKKGRSRLKVGQFSTGRGRRLWVHWKEPAPLKQVLRRQVWMLQKPAEITANRF